VGRRIEAGGGDASVWVQLLLLFFIGGSAGLAWLVLRRPESGPATYWVTGWLAAGVGGILAVTRDAFPMLHPLAHTFGSLFPVLLLAGAIVLTSRQIPRWFFPLALAYGMMRAGLVLAGMQGVA